MTRGGRSRSKETPERRCIVTRDVQPKTGLLRFVVGPDGDIVPDVSGRLPGRGIWVTARRDVLNEAIRRGGFARGAKRQVQVVPDLADRAEMLLARRLIELIALARKAGDAVSGKDKTAERLASGDAVLLVQAHDGSPRERAALRPPSGEKSHVLCLSADELGMAFGRDRVIHAAVLAGGLAGRIQDEALRLSGIRAFDACRTSPNAAGKEGAGEGPCGKG